MWKKKCEKNNQDVKHGVNLIKVILYLYSEFCWSFNVGIRLQDEQIHGEFNSLYEVNTINRINMTILY